MTPTDIAGLKLWLRADLGLYTDAAKTTPATADGDAVYTWADQSGNGNDAVQATLANRPLLKLAIQNGRAVVRFDGTNDSLATAAITIAQPLTIFVVGAAPVHTAINQLFIYREGSNPVIYRRTSDDCYACYAGNECSDGVADTLFHSLNCVFSGASSVFRNNGSPATLTPTNPGTGGYTTGVCIGGDSLSGQCLNGDIAEILVYDSALSTANRQSVETWLNERWNIYPITPAASRSQGFGYHLYVDWNDDGVYEADESAYLDSVQIQRGRRDIFTQPYVGKMTARLKNHTSRFTPWNTGSAIYPNVAPGRRVQMVVDINGVGYPIFSGRLDSPKTFSQKVGATPDVMTLTAQDGWRWLSDQKTNIALNTNIATGNAIVEVLSGLGWIASGVFIIGLAQLGDDGGANASNLGGAGVGENTRIDTGNDTISNWWTADESAAQSIWDLARSEFGRLQINGDGTLVFKARNADFGAAVDVQLTDSQVQEVSVDTPWEWVKNRVSVKANPRTLAGLAEVWYLRDTPYIQVGETLTLWAEFSDATGARVAVTGGVNPVATTDYTANTKADGTGTDKTANITVTPTFFSTAAKLVITQAAGATVYITFLHIRGQIVQAMDSQLMAADYAADQTVHGVIELSVDLPWQQSTLTAKDFAVWQLAFLKTPQVAPRVVMRGQSLPFIWDLGTKVQWNSTKLGFDKTFRVGEVTYDLKKGQDVRATWLLLPTGNENFWKLNDTWTFGDGLFVLGY